MGRRGLVAFFFLGIEVIISKEDRALSMNKWER